MNKIAIVMMLLSSTAMAYDDYPTVEEQMRESHRESDARMARREQEDMVYEQRKQNQLMREQIDMQRMNLILESKPGYLPDNFR